MFPTSLKTAAAVMIGVLLTATAALAESPVRRIDHPNGPATYVAKAPPRTTVALDANGQSFAVAKGQAPREQQNRRVPLHQGRGQTIYVETARQ